MKQPDPDLLEMLEAIREEERRVRRAAQSLAKAVSNSDWRDAITALHEANHAGGLTAAFRAVARGMPANKKFQQSFAAFWAQHGDSLRNAVTNDLVLADALRQMLPAYTGAALKLWRGEGFTNRRRRTYGASWSSEIDLADAFAKSRANIYKEGSVLLETVAPPEAVICALHEHCDDYQESEYVVDRRKLTAVRVVRRYPRTEPFRSAKERIAQI